MATLNNLEYVRPVVGQQAQQARASLTAVAGDDTAGSFTIDFSSKLKTVDWFLLQHRKSDGQLKAVKATISGTTITVADGATDTIAANDTTVVLAEGLPA